MYKEIFETTILATPIPVENKIEALETLGDKLEDIYHRESELDFDFLNNNNGKETK